MSRKTSKQEEPNLLRNINVSKLNPDEEKMTQINSRPISILTNNIKDSEKVDSSEEDVDSESISTPKAV